MKKTPIKLISMVIVLFFTLLISCNNQEGKSQTSNIQKDIEKTKDILSYVIKEKKDYSYLNNPRMSYRITLDVDKLPTKKQLESTAIKIWKEGNTNWKEFTVFMYLPEMDIESTAYYIAEFGLNGISRSEIQNYSTYGTKWWKDEEKQPEVDSDETGTQGKQKEYFVDLDITKLGDRKVKINIKTNFPEGTNMLVDATRIYYEKGKEEKYSGDIFSRDISVKEGTIETIFTVNDSLWYNKYYKDAKKFSGIIDYPGIGKISPEVEVSVLFSPRRDQPEKILKTLGQNGEFIKGLGAEKSTSFTTYRVSKLVDIPFKK